MAHISDRADALAKKFVKKDPVDTRPVDEKMVDFMQKWESRSRMNTSREKVKRARK